MSAAPSPRPRYGWRSLRVRLVAASVAVEIVVLAVLVWNSVRLAEGHLLAQSRRHVAELVPLLQASLAPALLEEDLARLHELADALTRGTGVRYLAVRDHAGAAVLRRGEPAADAAPAAPGGARGDATTPGRALRVASELTVSGYPVGSVELEMSTDLMAAARRSLRAQGVGLAAIELALSALALSVVGLALTRDLGRLVRAARAMAAGDLGARVGLARPDEIGEASRAFDVMAERIELARAALETERDRIRMILEAAAEGIVGLDADGRCRFANPAANALLAGAPGGLRRGDPVLACFRSGEGLRPPSAGAIRGGRSEHGDCETVTGRRVEWWLHPLGAEADRGAVLTFFDVTERRLAEVELARGRDQLERLVHERTRDLVATRDELVRRERLATIGQLTATVSHELRNPLGTIRTSLGALERNLGDAPAPVREILARIDRSIERCVSIIDRLLDFSRSRPIVPSVVDVDRWVRSVLAELALPDDVELELDLGAPGEAAFDRDYLQLALGNVVRNARQALDDAPAGAPRRIGVRTRRIGDRVEIRVWDTGPGLAPEHAERVFDPLFSTRAFGVGLGLPLVRRVLEEHGGEVELHPGPAGGLEVSLRLPVDAVAGPAL